MEIINKAKTYLSTKYGVSWDDIFKLRHYLHEYPERSLCEFKTREKLIEVLQKYGVSSSQISTYLHPGFVCDFIGTAPANGAKLVLALRSELDALSMEEVNTFPYASKNKGVAHMCGHDGHMATLMAVAQILVKYKDQIPSNKMVRLIFQPAEECGEGGIKMVKEGVLKDVDEVYALHNGPLPLGAVALRKEGAMSKGYLRFDININEKSGGAGEIGSRCVSALCSVQNCINTILALGISREEFLICTVGCMESSNGKGKMCGTIRFESLTILESFKEKLTNAVKRTSEALECDSTIDFSEFAAPVINSKQQGEYLYDSITEIMGPNSVKSLCMNASEDFSAMTSAVPGAFMVVGTAKEGEEIVSLHNPRFDYNDEIIPLSVAIWLKLIEKRLNMPAQ